MPIQFRPDWRAVLAALISLLSALIGGITVASFPGGCRALPAPPPKPAPPQPTPDPVQAIGRLVMPGGYCSATVIGPPDGSGPTRQRLVSAAHCVSRVGQRLTYVTRSGVSIPVTVIAVDRQADISILVTDQPVDPLPWVRVADRTPPPGTAVLHAGFGVDKPGNVERGTVVGGGGGAAQVEYDLSVSPGDSGGGICVSDGGELLSPVCCTTCLGCRGRVWGGSPERIRAMLTSPASYTDLEPVPMPPPPTPRPLP